MSNNSLESLNPKPSLPEGVDQHEWDNNLSDPALYAGIAPDLSREEAVSVDETGEGQQSTMYRFREILVQSKNEEWLDKTLAGLSHKPLWRNEETGASISLIRFKKGSGIPLRHSHASNQFMFCLKGKYRYVPTNLVLEEGSFYWNPKGCLHGPTHADEDTILLEVYDGPHYPTQPEWYSSPDDAV